MTSLPPKPTHNFFPLRFSPPVPVTEGERRRMIEVEAYLRAEQRNFTPADEVDDWVKAEVEVDKRLAHIRRLAGISVG